MRRRKHRLILPLLRTGGAVAAPDTFTPLVISLSPILWYKFNEASGTVLTNYGSGTGTGTSANCTLAQTGQRGTLQAYSFNGTTSIVTVPNHTSWADMLDIEWTFLVNATNAGEGNAGRFIDAAATYVFRLGVGGILIAVNGSATATTSTTLSMAAWKLVSYQCDAEGAIKIYINNVECSYTTNLSGLINNPLVDITLGNNAATTATFAGLFDEVFLTAPLTSQNRADLLTSLGL